MRRGGSEHRRCPAHTAMPAQLRLGFLKAATAPGTPGLKRYLRSALQEKRCRTPSISLPRSSKRRSAVRVPIPLKLTHFGRCSHETKAFDFGRRCQPAPQPPVGPSARSLSPMTAPRRHRTRLFLPSSPRPGPAHLQPPPPPPQNTRRGTATDTAAELRTNPGSPSLHRSLRPTATDRTLALPVAGAGPDGKSRAAARPGNPSRGGAASEGGCGQPAPTWAAPRRARCPSVPLRPAPAPRSRMGAQRVCGAPPGLLPQAPARP